MWGNIVLPFSIKEKAKTFCNIKGVIGGVFLVLFVIVLLLNNITTKPNGINIMVDQVVLGAVASQEQMEEALERIYQEKEIEGKSLFCISLIESEPVRVYHEEILGEDQLTDLLRAKLVFHYGAVGLSINGEQRAVLEDKAEAQRVVEAIKESFLPSEKDMERYAINILEVALEETIEFVPVEVEKEEIMSYEDTFELIKFGDEKITYHEVKSGNSLWTIANANGLSVEDLEAANPELNTHILQIGQQIRLIKPEPMLNVNLVYEQTTEERIPYTVRYVNTDSLWRGQQRVQDAGSSGTKEVVYLITKRNGLPVEKTVVNETILEEPKIRVVSVGTKAMVASRGGGGTGVLAWPTRGSITSPFGNRTVSGVRNYHTGIDINGNTGDPIYAAEAGTVIFSGWQGNYGNLIIIDHGDGLSTYYAHCSQRLVSIAAKVKRGDLIATIGSTGRSTGPHLHFEVRVNGTPVNPMNYLRD